MSYKFNLSTIATLIEWLEKYDAVGERQTPGLFLKENVCDQKLFVEKHLEKEIFENIVRYRDLIEFMLKTKSLPTNVQLIVHLYLMVFFMTKSTSQTILKSLKKSFSGEVVKDLIGLIDDEHFTTMVQNEDENFNKETLLGSLNEIKSKLCKSKLQLTAVSNCRHSQASTFATQSTIYRKKKSCSTNDSGASENKLEQILKKLPKQRKKNVKIMQFKKNTASILRAGALVKNKIKDNDLVIDELVSGSNDPKSVTDYFKKIIELKQMKEIQEIERKHLTGLISLEEAKIAKVEAVKRNQEVAVEMKQQRRQLLELLKREQEQQIVKSKLIIRKTHLGRLKVKKNQFDAVMEKKLSADEVKKFNEKLQKQVNEAREKEFQRKLELIQKMKYLEEKSKSGKAKNSKLDDYQKMSILELKVSIANLRKQLEEEKDARQKKIQKERERQKQLLTNAETLIEIRHKFNQEQKTEKTKHEIKPTPDLVMLREKLARMRQLTSKS